MAAHNPGVGFKVCLLLVFCPLFVQHKAIFGFDDFVNPRFTISQRQQILEVDLVAMAVIFPKIVPKMYYALESYLVVIPLLDEPECIVHVHIGWMLPVLLGANEQYFLAEFVKAGCSDMFHSGHKINLFLAINTAKIELRSGGKNGACRTAAAGWQSGNVAFSATLPRALAVCG